jgi:TolB protein
MRSKSFVAAATLLAVSGAVLLSRAGGTETPAPARKDADAAAAPSAMIAAPATAEAAPRAPRPVPADPREKHLANVRQLTFGGENA